MKQAVNVLMMMPQITGSLDFLAWHVRQLWGKYDLTTEHRAKVLLVSPLPLCRVGAYRLATPTGAVPAIIELEY